MLDELDNQRISEIASQNALKAGISRLPGWGALFDIAEAYYSASLHLRQERALEFVEMIKNKPGYFTQAILSDINFQDGFVYLFEAYLRERNEARRKILQNIFLGFAKTSSKENFPLERFSHTTSQLSSLDIETLKDTKPPKENDRNYQIYGNEKRNIVNIHNLVNLGLLIDDTGSRVGPVDAPFVRFTPFGKEFIEYLEKI